jgi:hypothetical protein
LILADAERPGDLRLGAGAGFPEIAQAHLLGAETGLAGTCGGFDLTIA